MYTRFVSSYAQRFVHFFHMILHTLLSQKDKCDPFINMFRHKHEKFWAKNGQNYRLGMMRTILFGWPEIYNLKK